VKTTFNRVLSLLEIGIGPGDDRATWGSCIIADTMLYARTSAEASDFRTKIALIKLRLVVRIPRPRSWCPA
jgi:hypothetical protein